MAQPSHAFTTPWRQFPYGTRSQSHLFAVGDVHGRADLLERLLDHLDVIPTEAGLRRALVFTGDYIDRGPESLRAIDLVLAADARPTMKDGRVVLLPGNHEAMLLEGLTREGDPRRMLWLWARNGGVAVVDEIAPDFDGRMEDLRPLLRARLPSGFIKRMLDAPSHYKDGDLLFVHAGLDPSKDQAAFLAQKLFGERGQEEHWAWIREDFLDWTGGWDHLDGDDVPGPTVVVHGHTFCTYRSFGSERAALEAMDRAHTHKRICLDVGSFQLGQLAALETVGERYRFHVVQV